MFSIKIALAVSAFAVAILAVSDLKSVKEAGPGEKTPWYRRLTIWGVTKIVLAAMTLGLGGLNEYLSAESSADAATKETELQRKISDQQLKLADARAALSSVAAKLDATSRTIDLFDKTARNERVLEGVYQASMSPMSGISYDFVNHQGAKYRPIRDDKIEFNSICRGGPTPTLSSCSVGNYGYLVADGDKPPVTALTVGLPAQRAGAQRLCALAPLRHADGHRGCPLIGVDRSAPGDRQGVDGASPSR